MANRKKIEFTYHYHVSVNGAPPRPKEDFTDEEWDALTKKMLENAGRVMSDYYIGEGYTIVPAE